MNKYSADGYLFCARWKNFADGKDEQRQWWETLSPSNSLYLQSKRSLRKLNYTNKKTENKKNLARKIVWQKKSPKIFETFRITSYFCI